MYLGKAAVNSFEKGARKEWLISNGVGGYSTGTIIGANTSRTHGLLMVKYPEAEDHYVLVAKTEDEITLEGKKYLLSTNQYNDLVYPDGYRYLQEFFMDPLPHFLYVIHGTMIQKTVFMPHGKNNTIIKYELLASPHRLTLDVKPMMAFRSIRETRTHKNDAFMREPISNGVRVNCNSMSAYLLGEGMQYLEKTQWFENIQYQKDSDDVNINNAGIDKLWTPGSFYAEMGEGDIVYFVLSDRPVSNLKNIKLLETEERRKSRSMFMSHAGKILFKSTMGRSLIHASNHFLSLGEKEDEMKILTGFPSLSENARETFLSIAGLLICFDKFTETKHVFNRWFRQIDNGLCPDTLHGIDGENTFHSADSGLLMIYALDKYVQVSGDIEYIAKNWISIKSMVNRYITGISNIDMKMDDSDGMLCVMGEAKPCSWMSGRIDGEPIVVRKGKLVEINALWYNALRAVERMADALQDKESINLFGEIADKVRAHFLDVFLCRQKGYLYDWVNGDKKDDTIRPNQLLTVSLPSSPLEPEIARSILEIIWDNLYTTYGIRTMDPHHDKFKGRLEGRKDQKIKAFYRGMAWPWLLAQFISAFMRYNPKRMDVALSFLRPFISHLDEDCIGSVSQVFDGSMPYLPHGDMTYSISVSELLRVMVEDMLPVLQDAGDSI